MNHKRNRLCPIAVITLLFSVCSAVGYSRSTSITPTSVAFGTVAAGASKQQTVTINNTGSAAVSVNSVSVSGASTLTFSGWSSSRRLLPGQKLALTVVFSPTSSASYSGTLKVSTTSTSYAVPLTGTGSSPASAVNVSVSPTSPALQSGVSQQFTSSVSGTTNTAVTWSVNGVAGGNSTIGTISSAGLYKAPTVGGTTTETVKATSVADPTKSASASVSVSPVATPVTLAISPTSSSLQGGQTQQFASTITGTTNTAVNWAVNGVKGGNSNVGTVSTVGLYTAPVGLASSANMNVTAQSVYDSSSSAMASVLVASSSSSGSAPGCTKYVAATGQDSNSGLSASTPWLTLNHAASSATAGDVVCVADGTYSECGSGSAIAYVGKSGTASQPITFQSTNKWGAQLVGPAGSCQYGFELYGSYITVKDFDISGFATDAGGQGVILAGGNHHVIQGNRLHNLSNYSTNSGYGMNGIFVYQSSSYDMIDSNIFHDIGRTNSYTYWADHGIYDDGGTYTTIQNNVFYNITHGWGVQLGSQPNSNILINNNTFDINNSNATGDIVMESVCTNCRIANNIFYNPTSACLYNYTSLSGGSFTIDNNQCTLNTLVSPSGSFYTTSNNQTSVSTSGLMANPSNHDYHLVSGSKAIDAGSPTSAPDRDFDDSTRPQGAGYDIGAYEY